MDKERNLVRIFVEINEKESEISYHLGSWGGPRVTPRRFYPSRLVKLTKEGDGPGRKYVPRPLDLICKAPRDMRVNAYVVGDQNFFGVQTGWSIIQASPGQEYSSGRLESGQHFGNKDMNQQVVCVTYCMLSQRDLNKNAENQ